METGESTFGARERENKTRNQTVRRMVRRNAVEKQDDGEEGGTVRQVGGFPQEQLEM